MFILTIHAIRHYSEVRTNEWLCGSMQGASWLRCNVAPSLRRCVLLPEGVAAGVLRHLQARKRRTELLLLSDPLRQQAWAMWWCQCAADLWKLPFTFRPAQSRLKFGGGDHRCVLRGCSCDTACTYINLFPGAFQQPEENCSLYHADRCRIALHSCLLQAIVLGVT